MSGQTEKVITAFAIVRGALQCLQLLQLSSTTIKLGGGAVFEDHFSADCIQASYLAEKPSPFFGFLSPMFSYVFKTQVGVVLLCVLMERSSLILLILYV